LAGTYSEVLVLERAERGTFIRQYISEEGDRLRSRAQSEGFRTLQSEPPTALFVTEANITTLGIQDAGDVMRAKVKAKLCGTWRKEALDVLERLKKHGIDRVAVGRTGGPYHTYPTKRLSRWQKYYRALTYEVSQYWERPWWEEHGRKQRQDMVLHFKDKTIQNLYRIEQDPDLVVGEKEPSTGTGWRGTLSTRYEASKHIRGKIPRIIDVIEHYMDDYVEALDYWPQYDVRWHIRSDMYKGIWGGVRSDADITKWSELDCMNIEVGTREVGNTPESAWHNKKLDDRGYRMRSWEKFTSKYHMMPFDAETYITLLTTPPVTQVDPGEPGVFSIDFGYVSPAATFTKSGDKWTINQPKEKVKLGADNIVESGLFTQTAEGRDIAHIKSGQSDTAHQYNISAGGGIAALFNEKKISAKIGEIGDDIHMVVKPEEVPVILDDMGNWMRTKGFTNNLNFIWGHWLYWKDKENVVSWITPRIYKSMTSPRMRKRRGKTTMGPEDYRVDVVESDVIEQIDRFWKLYPEMVYFEGSRDEYRQLLAESFIPSSELLVAQGLSEWLEYYLLPD
jgi:hypothetical protein